MTGIVGLIYQVSARREQRKQNRIDVQFKLHAYPFVAYSTDDLSDLYEESIGPSSTITYVQRNAGTSIGSQVLGSQRVLLIGRTGIGKTREALEAINLLAKEEADPMTVFRPDGYIGRPMVPEAIPSFSKRPVLFIDDIDQFYRNDSDANNELVLAESIHERLVDVSEWFSKRSSRFLMICTAEDDSFIENLDAEQKKFWSEFKIIQVPELHKGVLPKFIRSAANDAGVQIDNDAIEIAARKCDATCKGIVDAVLRTAARSPEDPRITAADAAKFVLFGRSIGKRKYFDPKSVKLHSIRLYSKLWV